MRFACSVVTVAIMVVMSVACDQATPTPLPTPTPTPMPVDTKLEAVLGWVPVQYASEKVDYAAYQAAAVASGFEDFDGIETIRERGYPRFFWGVEPDFSPDWLTYWPQIGIDPYTSDLGIYREGTEGPRQDFHVFQGDFEEDQVIASLGDLGYKTDSYQGIAYYYFWNDTERRELLDYPLHAAGYQLNAVALVGDQLIAASYIDTLKSLIDLQQSQEKSLLDSKSHRTLAEQFENGLLSMRFVDEDWLISWYLRRASRKPSPDELLALYVNGPKDWGKLSAYSEALLGYQVTDGQDEMVTALYYSDPEAAARDAEELEKRWNTYLLYESSFFGPGAKTVSLTDFCAPFSTKVVQYSDSSVLIGTCQGVATEGSDVSKAAHLWQRLIPNGDYLFLVTDIEQVAQAIRQQ